jgi:hypothetical protein
LVKKTEGILGVKGFSFIPLTPSPVGQPFISHG